MLQELVQRDGSGEIEYKICRNGVPPIIGNLFQVILKGKELGVGMGKSKEGTESRSTGIGKLKSLPK